MKKKNKHFELEQHLAAEHNISPLATYLREIVYGGTDGIVTTFAVVAGFTGAQMSNMGVIPLLSVLIFGFANLFADGFSMALGNFLSGKSKNDVYRNEKLKELAKIRNNPKSEEKETVEILARKGFTRKQAKDLAAIYMTNEEYWLDFMMQRELGMPSPEGDNHLFMATATFLSFVFFGLFPLLPYILFRSSENLFFYSSVAAAVALSSLGVLRMLVAKKSWLRSIGETLLLGGTAAAVAYFVGTLFHL